MRLTETGAPGGGALRPAVFLDRDGTINANVFYDCSGKWEAPRTVDRFTLLPGALDALAALQAAGFGLVLVSNQPNHALGKASPEDMAAIHRRLVAELARAGIRLTDAFYCYHHPNGRTPGLSGPCVCRKPSPYYLLRARDRHGIDMGRSWMVGDRASDIQCGRAAGVRTILVTSPGHAPPGADEPAPDHCAASLNAAAAIILAA
ncbi:D-glycero-alpha-D-manno-heptose-1,7-bisphosphate 7-phosphatase [Azospirillum rugosum]|uniref:D,D-heptose 1,7-bisphosphate phosphatase n=1 Tax=Azospirillum rugosum TaxID=416170 RepID=A0ABS4SP10_9PROT|nr:HAD-IIIA family hydrolase [Azospirillum rugosum]MBP2294306.1 D-glycero-D-manno-heptose 1,7-bisphosphate phosphatase [Azospirillum rugosum]MDQ0527641.1 D-glycero-D-manno-heptose 1,7-bisphosphate phosphatase [Azospirillum rugosum]